MMDTQRWEEDEGAGPHTPSSACARANHADDHASSHKDCTEPQSRFSPLRHVSQGVK